MFHLLENYYTFLYCSFLHNYRDILKTTMLYSERIAIILILCFVFLSNDAKIITIVLKIQIIKINVYFIMF